MLEALTDFQTDQLSRFVQKWTDIGNDTRPLDRAKAQAAVELAYECAGQLRPTKFVWFQSPLALEICASKVKSPLCHNGEVCDTLEIQMKIDSQLNGNVQKHVLDCFRFGELLDIESYIEYETSYSIETGDIQSSIWQGISDSLWEAGLGDLWDRLTLRTDSDWVLEYCPGSIDCGLGYYDFWGYFGEILGITAEIAELNSWVTTACECGWWVPFDDLVLISEKPLIINSSLVRYSDGFEVQL